VKGTAVGIWISWREIVLTRYLGCNDKSPGLICDALAHSRKHLFDHFPEPPISPLKSILHDCHSTHNKYALSLVLKPKPAIPYLSRRSVLLAL